MAKTVRLKLRSADPHLVAAGFLYATPAPTTDPPDAHGFSIRSTVWAEFDLPAGSYDFRFNVKNGEGAFTLVASGATAGGGDATGAFDTKSGADRLVFRFTVEEGAE